MNQLSGGGGGLGTPTFDALQVKREWPFEEGVPPTAAGTSACSSDSTGVEILEETGEEDMDNYLINSTLVEVMEEEDEDDDMGEGDGQVEDDYPPNYGGPKSEVEKLRGEVTHLKENYEGKVKNLEETLAKSEEALAESEEDRMHARIILQYEKDEKERIIKLLYDEQRKTRQLRGQLHAIFGVKKNLGGGGGKGNGGEGKEEDVTCLGTVVVKKKSGGGGGSGSSPSEIISKPVIDRTKIYATNRNNIGGGGGGAMSATVPAPFIQQRSNVVAVASRPVAGPSGVGPMSHRQQVAPPPPLESQKKRQSLLSKSDRVNLTKKVYRGIGTLSRPRALQSSQSQPQPSTSQAAVAAMVTAQPTRPAVAAPAPAPSSTIAIVKMEEPSRQSTTTTAAIFRPRRPYKKRGRSGRQRGKACSTAERDAEYFRRNKDKTNFPCNMCPQRFLKLSLLKYHKRQSHNVEDLSLQGVGCVECGFVFADRKRLFDHRLEAHNIPHPYGKSQGGASQE